jgi:hypothetical protein
MEQTLRTKECYTRFMHPCQDGGLVCLQSASGEVCWRRNFVEDCGLKRLRLRELVNTAATPGGIRLRAALPGCEIVR